MKFGYIDLIGIIGGLFVLFAFWRTSLGKWTGTSLWYELDNLVGSTLIVIYTLSKGAYINVGLNIIWAVVAFRGVTSYAERRSYRKSKKSAP
jgi:hypothetical protein